MTSTHRIAATPTPEREVLAALKAARQFIVNGVEFGYIRMPDADTPDTAHDTLPMIEKAIAALSAPAPQVLPAGWLWRICTDDNETNPREFLFSRGEVKNDDFTESEPVYTYSARAALQGATAPAKAEGASK
jgi:hypothetical protein